MSIPCWFEHSKATHTWADASYTTVPQACQLLNILHSCAPRGGICKSACVATNSPIVVSSVKPAAWPPPSVVTIMVALEYSAYLCIRTRRLSRTTRSD